MKRLISIALIALMTTIPVLANDGMWLPILLQYLNEKEMQEMGMKITADDIYSINHASMKDAVMLFGGGCTCEVVSNKGLLLTNYHCGYGSIQRHSAIDHDYLTNGFWAKDISEELPCPGLTTNLMVEMRDVTERINNAVNDKMTQAEREKAIEAESQKIIKETTAGTHYQGSVESYYKGNQFFLIIYEEFKDVRLVGAPPSNIGKFGGDTDNWMWPRHTGDFSIFRIYVDKDNKPAEYSPDNKPYQPKYYFNISLEGVNEGDFTMVFGYPARTNEYEHSGYVYNTVEVENPIVINIRDKKLAVMKAYSEQSPQIRIQYANKIASLANGWKKMIGQSLGIQNVDGIQMKKDYEKAFQQWADNSHKEYSTIVPSLEKYYNDILPYRKTLRYISEAGIGTEIISFSGNYTKLITASKADKPDNEKISKIVETLRNQAKTFYKDYNKDIDREICPQMLEIFYSNVDMKFMPSFFTTIRDKYKGDFEAYADYIFKNSLLSDSTKLYAFLDNYSPKKYKTLEKDPCYVIFTEMIDKYNGIRPQIGEYQNNIDSVMHYYMKAQMEFEEDRRFYPDANFTLRVSYGKVEGFKPMDAVRYDYFTTLDGIIEKEDPNIYDYVVEDKLKELWRNKDYGRYADKDGTMHTCFLASNHTTGGNSGSPVINAKGELIGLNFDRNWQGTMSDIIYDPNVCRNIIVDIRYVLFIIDKFAGASHLVKEMKIANSQLYN